MTKNLFTSGLYAGLVAGLIAVLLQFFLMQPLILEGEEYESGAKVHFNGAQVGAAPVTDGHDHSSHDHGTDEAGEKTGAENNFKRLSLTFFADFVVFVGWGLIMVAGFSVAERYGHKLSVKNGLLWGGAGFIAVHVATGVGLPPELPGTPAADLQSRQIWWIATAFSSAAGLAFFAFGRSAITVAIGLALLVAPHIIGAPKLDEYYGLGPPELAGEYVARSYAIAMAAWLSLGLAAGYFWTRQQNAE